METNLNNSLQPTSVSVLMINAQGMMLSVLGQDYFVSYNRVPWLRDARVSSALNVRMAGPNAIEWPELVEDLLPGDAVRVDIVEEADGSRRLTF